MRIQSCPHDVDIFHTLSEMKERLEKKNIAPVAPVAIHPFARLASILFIRHSGARTNDYRVIEPVYSQKKDREREKVFLPDARSGEWMVAWEGWRAEGWGIAWKQVTRPLPRHLPVGFIQSEEGKFLGRPRPSRAIDIITWD
jgi:hypothetical protein